MELYKDKKWLYNKYKIEKLSTINIGKICNVSFQTIYKWLKRHNIQVNLFVPDDIGYHRKDWLYDKYIKDKMTSRKIAKLCKTGKTTILNALKRLDIPIRTAGEAFHLSQGNHCNLSQEAIEWINGELLGDGCLRSPRGPSAIYSHSSKYYEYLEYVIDTLKSFGIRAPSGPREYNSKVSNGHHKSMDSLSYTELLPIRKKWYPNGKKIVPRDIKLTPLTCRQWYIGDGCLQRGRYIIMATCGFTISDVNWLVEQLIELGFKATRQPSCNCIIISTYSTKAFLDYIGKCPVNCYQYKWNYKTLSKDYI